MSLSPEARESIVHAAKERLHKAAAAAHHPGQANSALTFRGAVIILWHFGVAGLEIALDVIETLGDDEGE